MSKNKNSGASKAPPQEKKPVAESAAESSEASSATTQAPDTPPETPVRRKYFDTLKIVQQWIDIADDEEREKAMEALKTSDPELYAAAYEDLNIVRAATTATGEVIETGESGESSKVEDQASEGVEGGIAVSRISSALQASMSKKSGPTLGGADWGSDGAALFETGAVAQGLPSKGGKDDFAEAGEPYSPGARISNGYWPVKKGGVIRLFYLGTTSRSEAQAIAQAQLGNVDVL